MYKRVTDISFYDFKNLKIFANFRSEFESNFETTGRILDKFFRRLLYFVKVVLQKNI